jgi:hypothetical protein
MDLRRSCAFTATMTVLADIKIAATAGASSIPHAARTPAAKGDGDVTAGQHFRADGAQLERDVALSRGDGDEAEQRGRHDEQQRDGDAVADEVCRRQSCAGCDAPPATPSGGHDQLQLSPSSRGGGQRCSVCCWTGSLPWDARSSDAKCSRTGPHCSRAQ